MPVEVDADALAVELEALGREQAVEAADRASTASQEHLTTVGDERDFEVFPIVRSATPGRWDSDREAAVFDYTHRASRFLNDGTQTHEIVADDGVLAFEWPDAPQEVQDMFESTFPTVFFPRVEVDGIDAIRYLEYGLGQAADWLEGQ